MALGFRKSILGYNCEEVSEHLHKKDYENKQIVASLNQKINGLTDELSKINGFNAELSENIKNLSEQLDFYKSKYEEVKALSENIGKLYLVAQTNAKAIIKSANETRTLTENEIENNLTLINNTNTSLSLLKGDLINLSNSFVSEIERLTNSLEQIKHLAQGAKGNADSDVENFEKIYNSIVK